VTQSVSEHLKDLAKLAEQCADVLAPDLAIAADLMSETVRSGGTLFFCGNGGSAADAQHLVAEYVIRFGLERRGVPAIALSADSAVLTAAANDYDYAIVFSRQLETLGRAGDLLVIHSTSGNSPNVVEAARAAASMNIRTLALTAKGGGILRSLADHCVVIPTGSSSRAQELHMCIQHAICARIDIEVGS